MKKQSITPNQKKYLVALLERSTIYSANSNHLDDLKLWEAQMLIDFLVNERALEDLNPKLVQLIFDSSKIKPLRTIAKNMISPRSKYTLFNSDKEKIAFLINCSLLPSKASKLKKFYYKGIAVSSPVECDVIGFIDEHRLVVQRNDNNEIGVIFDRYFKDMQSDNFTR